MINFNNICIVGVDLGYGNIKTARTIFPTGLTVHNTEPIFSGKILQYSGKYYKIGDCHKPFIPDKTADEDFYILTLAAIASELRTYNINEAEVHIAAGLPLSLVKAQREQFRKYITKNEIMEFTFNKKIYKIKIGGCTVLPQGYPAIIENTSLLSGVNMLADIGNGTMNVMYINNKKPIEEKSYTEKIGVNQFVIAAQNAVTEVSGKVIDPAIIQNFILNGTADISKNYLDCLRGAAENYCNSIFDTLAKYEYDPDFMKLFIVGGGGRLIKNFGSYNSERVIFIDDLCASAKGFEKMAFLKMRNKK